ncbi:tail-anchored insertion receptor WRB [Chlorella sorokiniana]|uniref:Tail-anchored insertion receptor WRB n=1 Tax=Chlorella sorokiniana TaxID=3076 RepID=A0A2P6TYI1_CHLSO|nr:tail-anchored insertion receptor WRB [Chlorella sorokiniana]|eukprot:PRW59129.1 tail-anchored insertion receptor WRB [Chlorella sorokiniana]
MLIAAGALNAGQLAALTLVATFALSVLERLIKRWKVPDTRRQQFDLQQEVAHLQRQAAALNHPDTFAQSAKAERKAIALAKELAKLQSQSQVPAGARFLLRLPALLRLALLGWLVYQSTAVPVVAQLRPETVWPLGRWLSIGAGKASAPGAVGLLAWAMLCQRVSAALLGRS